MILNTSDLAQPFVYTPFALELDRVLGAAFKRRELKLPDFSNTTHIGIFTDYSGESSDSKSLVFGVFICDMSYQDSFFERMTEIRTEFFQMQPDKEISFKSRKYEPVHKCFPKYLGLLEDTPGFLFTMTIEKDVAGMFTDYSDSREGNHVAKLLREKGLSRRKGKETIKLMVVAHTIAYLMKLLTPPNKSHKLLWMMDNDEITPQGNEVKIKEATQLFGSLLGLYDPKKRYDPEILCAFPMTPLTDMLSAADLAAGTIGYYVKEGILSEKSNADADRHLKLLTNWIDTNHRQLKKWNVAMRMQNGKVEGNNVQIATLRQIPDGDYHLNDDF
jgi:hypothetical protein